MKYIIVLSACIMLLGSCHKGPEDYVGVYDFRMMSEEIVMDTTEIVYSFFGKANLKIGVYKLSPLKIDIFKEGDKLSGTCSFHMDWSVSQMSKVGQQKLFKSTLHNIHVVHDTLVADFPLRNKELKLIKQGDNSFVIIPNLALDDGNPEKCNAFARIIGDEVCYSLYHNSEEDQDKAKTSEECSVELKVNTLIKNGYKEEKKEYLKGLLSHN